MKIHIKKLTKPTADIAAAFNKWENDPALVHLIHPNQNEEALQRRKTVTVNELAERIKHSRVYLIYVQGELIGTIDYQVDPIHLHKQIKNTAWLGILIGEEIGRGKGIGAQAIRYLEKQIKLEGLKRIELGVFEFNSSAIKLYQRVGYQEFARIDNFTYWQGKMWQDIRMEKYFSPR